MFKFRRMDVSSEDIASPMTCEHHYNCKGLNCNATLWSCNTNVLIHVPLVNPSMISKRAFIMQGLNFRRRKTETKVGTRILPPQGRLQMRPGAHRTADVLSGPVPDKTSLQRNTLPKCMNFLSVGILLKFQVRCYCLHYNYSQTRIHIN